MNIVLEPSNMRKIAYKLREESEDLYLFFMCMYQTGYTGETILRLKTYNLEEFIDKNKVLLERVLIEELRIHNTEYEDGYFFRNKYSDAPMPRRTAERSISYAAKEMLNKDDFGFKTISKTFYYEYFRNNNYNFNKLKHLFNSRRQYMGSIDIFLKYCGLTVEEYQEDYYRNKNLDVRDYMTSMKELNNTVLSICTNTNLSVVQKQSLELILKNILIQLEPFTES